MRVTGQFVAVCSQRGADRQLRASSSRQRAVTRVPILPCQDGKEWGKGLMLGWQVCQPRLANEQSGQTRATPVACNAVAETSRIWTSCSSRAHMQSGVCTPRALRPIVQA